MITGYCRMACNYQHGPGTEGSMVISRQRKSDACWAIPVSSARITFSASVGYADHWQDRNNADKPGCREHVQVARRQWNGPVLTAGLFGAGDMNRSPNVLEAF